ncbi:putative RNA splicing factor [Cavenderia fasciculata]|uniref:Pre-mRNA-splicing factor SLU7 n=1 Tax=Cavenderia fasciculata TaxID=261658 RepID=F4PL79_CACFS|nr:putative RNA splicing factor [Cavenderia fasciculata]EGG23301.1 putative RNA splicing factor [Cavenderia fasciculata]|eukprot:XP_004361152.1 putative RNA splicing factor [Cavenderia fasciculata]
MASSATDHWKKREEWKKQKELEEARKEGTAPAEVDEDGKEINPHIPQYMMQAPWYVSTNKPSLKHQRAFNKKTDYDKGWYERGAQAAPASTKYRKGACTNCGAMTHKAKDCCERPRKVGAKFSNDDIKADEVVQTLDLDYDGKRDPYNGYDPDSFKEVVDLYERADAARKKKKLEEIMKQYGMKESEAAAKQEELLKDEEDKSFDVDGMDLHQRLDPKSRTTIRNLRIREDTAKYLYNLDLDSAFYEPKSRSMRDNPLPNAGDIPFAGDNFTRASGDTKNFGQMQMFSWEAYDKGQDVDLNAAPSQAALLHLEFLQKKEALKNKAKETLVNKYGEQTEKADEDAAAADRIAQTEVYTEYSASGKLIKGEEKLVKSKYEEDVYSNNHKSVWGSYWESGQWGYQCCKQTIKQSYCTGEAGRKLKDQSRLQLQQQQTTKDQSKIETTENDKQQDENNNNNNNQQQKSLLEQKESMTEKEKRSIEKEKRKKEKQEEKDRKKRFKKALKEQDDHAKSNVETDERKRGYNSFATADDYNVTEEDLEAYNLKRVRGDDPMANYKE